MKIKISQETVQCYFLSCQSVLVSIASVYGGITGIESMNIIDITSTIHILAD